MNQKLFSQAQDEFQTETISFNATIPMKNDPKTELINNNTQYSQFVPKKSRQSTSMVFSIQAQEQFDLDELTKQPYFKEDKSNAKLRTKTNQVHNTPSIKQIQVDPKFYSQNKTKKRRILSDNSAPSKPIIKISHPLVLTPNEFKYTKRSQAVNSESSAITRSHQKASQAQKTLTIEEKLHRLSQQQKATLNIESQKPSQLELIKEDHTEVDDEQETFFFNTGKQVEKNKFHHFLKIAPLPKRVVTFSSVIKKVGDIEFCIGIEGKEEITYFRRVKSEKAKLYNHCNIQVE
ncbi:unnamed protein product (macronuclear) [Paramecium tetraurelia]|uniref:Uncharacterized protein n=1 Tax=Paramecium tetraurelia TaxID=5888 RepID=A0CFD5_PARTE|nr:uncharacterized protein GSPATT00037941001 [Paramecium tetraurelia]CAK69502.1 unnamed protein product [Paramecium tetraurelia]|eukprot:XP_001436899.1 hypothetical protein (macronuclear) [Paramecium tetraurelia strain d4-2]